MMLAAFLSLLVQIATAQSIGYGLSGSSAPIGIFPDTVAEAVADGWSHQSSDGVVDGLGYPFTKSDLERFTLYYTSAADDNGELAAFSVTGSEWRDVNGDIQSIPGSKPIGDGRISYDVILGDDMKVGDIGIPSTYVEAEGANGWTGAACVPLMGGTHYRVTPDEYTSDYLFAPIYDTHGTGRINAFILAVADDGSADPVPGFDLGGIALGLTDACVISQCGVPGCMVEQQMFRSVHIYLNVDPETATFKPPSCDEDGASEFCVPLSLGPMCSYCPASLTNDPEEVDSKAALLAAWSTKISILFGLLIF